MHALHENQHCAHFDDIDLLAQAAAEGAEGVLKGDVVQGNL